MKDGLRQEPSSSAITEVKQRDRRDPITVVIAGPPVAKARPRATRRGFVYTPAHTRKLEAHGRRWGITIPPCRPRLELERDGWGWLVLLPSGHAWLFGDRAGALREFAGLVDIERRGSTT